MRLGYAIALSTALLSVATGVKAQERSPINLIDEAIEVPGITAGSDSFTRLASRDRRRKICLGFGDSKPDHTLILPREQPRLRISVNSEGRDTTLLIQGPNGIDCNDNYRREHRDAGVTDRDWPAGTYQIWVGSFNRGDRINYTLRIGPPQPR